MIKDLMSEYHISKASVYRLLQAAAAGIIFPGILYR